MFVDHRTTNIGYAVAMGKQRANENWEAVDALADALRAMGIGPVHTTARAVKITFAPELNISATVVPISTARPGLARKLDPSEPLIVVADQVPAAQRAELDAAGIGWLDRRGHLKFRHLAVYLDADVPADERHSSRPRRSDPVAGPLALAVAVSALDVYPEPLLPVRELARRLGGSASGVSEAATRLIEAGLLTQDREAAVPGLFWAVADAWTPTWHDLDAPPPPHTNGLLAVGPAAAAALGAPLAGKDLPIDLLCRDDRALRALLRRRPSRRSNRTFRVALTPSAALFDDRPRVEVAGYLCADPAIVAASIAGDRARGAEVVESWKVDDRAW